MHINEIFFSLQGEGINTGLPTIFIRTTGCNIRCNYCDTGYAFFKGKKIQIEDIIKQIKKYPCQNICITGGEPMLQKNIPDLINELIKNKYSISIETNGTKPIKDLPSSVDIVMDIKTPSSGEAENNLLENIKHLKKSDSIKFVVSDKKDFNWSLKILKDHKPNCHIFFSPAWQKCKESEIAEWILSTGQNYRLSLQAHKYIWGDVKGR